MEMIDYERLSRTIRELATALEPIILALRETWETIKPVIFAYKDYFKEKKQIKHMRSSWFIPKDARKKNQVMMNKPRFMVRKVIR